MRRLDRPLIFFQPPVIVVVDALDPLFTDASITLSAANRTGSLSSGGSVQSSTRSLFSRNSGKVYFEVVANLMPSFTGVNIAVATSAAPTNVQPGTTANTWAIVSDGRSYHTGVLTAYFGGYSAGNTLQCAVDFGAGSIWFGANNTFGGSPSAGTGAAFTGVTGPLFAMMGLAVAANTSQGTIALNAADQTYTPPSGFSAWN